MKPNDKSRTDELQRSPQPCRKKRVSVIRKPQSQTRANDVGPPVEKTYDKYRNLAKDLLRPPHLWKNRNRPIFLIHCQQGCTVRGAQCTPDEMPTARKARRWKQKRRIASHTTRIVISRGSRGIQYGTLVNSFIRSTNLLIKGSFVITDIDAKKLKLHVPGEPSSAEDQMQVRNDERKRSSSSRAILSRWARRKKSKTNILDR